jgi:hypothetical protein
MRANYILEQRGERMKTERDVSKAVRMRRGWSLDECRFCGVTVEETGNTLSGWYRIKPRSSIKLCPQCAVDNGLSVPIWEHIFKV